MPPEYPEESHNSTVSCESVDAPTLACDQGYTHRLCRYSIFEHVPFVSPSSIRASNCLPPANPAHLYTDKPRSQKGSLGLSLVLDDRSPRCGLVTATANGRGVYESLSPETLTFTALPRAAPSAALVFSRERSAQRTASYRSFWPGKAPPTTSSVTVRLYCGNVGS